MEKVAVFIDGPNLFWGMSDYSRSLKINYMKFVDKLVGDRSLLRAYFYCSHPVPIPEEQKKFFDNLQFNGIQVVGMPLKKVTEQRTKKTYYVEKGEDVALVTDMLTLAFEHAYDTAIIVSGDADFIGAIEKIKYKGKRVEVVSFKNSLSGELRRVADKLVLLDDIIGEIKM